jgi:uncharacterized repeat protein (TIGR03837 family)
MRVVHQTIRNCGACATLLMNHRETWDLFCHVVDNFGDIGVGWRLARQLAHEHGRNVRLFVDDLNTYRLICPQINPRLAQQSVDGVQVFSWSRQLQLEPGDVVVELFGCKLAPPYVERVQQRGPDRARWINLEHLSAEPWVEGSHLRPSPQPGGINKLFFFPGFTPATGGLIREADLLTRRDAWQAMPAARRIALRSLNLPPPPEHALTILLFSYARDRLESWLQSLAADDRPTMLWICPGPILSAVNSWLHMELLMGQTTVRGSLTLCALPYVPQDRFDELLWAADICIVRGEDSFVRAQWAARPMVWHIYPQHDDAHDKKLGAFMDLYLKDAPLEVRDTVIPLWTAWNKGLDLESAWSEFIAALPQLRRHAHRWCNHLATQPDLAHQLIVAGRVERSSPAPLL